MVPLSRFRDVQTGLDGLGRVQIGAVISKPLGLHFSASDVFTAWSLGYRVAM